jgi:hypothetical protein
LSQRRLVSVREVVLHEATTEWTDSFHLVHERTFSLGDFAAVWEVQQRQGLHAVRKPRLPIWRHSTNPQLSPALVLFVSSLARDPALL